LPSTDRSAHGGSPHGGHWPDNPVLVEVRRSGFLESVHRGSLVVLDAEGSVRFGAGAVDRPTLPRSSNKPVQATALLGAGWAPRSGEELAIGAGSHNGEDGHRDLAAAMLTAVGLGPDDLGCPAAMPIHGPTSAAWLAAGRAPERLAMNCSGKHAAMLSACVAAGWPTAGYLDRSSGSRRGWSTAAARRSTPCRRPGWRGRC
jgi:L-asparaginase II